MKDALSDDDHLSIRAKVLFTGAAVVILAFLLFAGAEIYVRATKPIEDLWALTGRSAGYHRIHEWANVDAFSAYRGRPGTYRHRSVTKTVNSEGFISTPPIAVTKPAHTIRIAFLGESSTAGTGILLPDSETWPWMAVENVRHRAGRRDNIEFLNAALGGFTTFESFGRLWSRVRFFSPDIVVVYHGWNDMNYFGRVDRIEFWRTLPNGSWSLDYPVVLTVYAPRWYDYLIRPSQLLTRVRLRLSTPI